MRCEVKHTSPGRLRVHLCKGRMSLREADVLEYYLRAVPGVTRVQVLDRTCDAVIFYAGPRADVTRALARFSFAAPEAAALVPDHTSRALNREFEDKLAGRVLMRAVTKAFFPLPLRAAIALVRAVPYLKAGVQALLRG